MIEKGRKTGKGGGHSLQRTSVGSKLRLLSRGDGDKLLLVSIAGGSLPWTATAAIPGPRGDGGAAKPRGSHGSRQSRLLTPLPHTSGGSEP